MLIVEREGKRRGGEYGYGQCSFDALKRRHSQQRFCYPSPKASNDSPRTGDPARLILKQSFVGIERHKPYRSRTGAI